MNVEGKAKELVDKFYKELGDNGCWCRDYDGAAEYELTMDAAKELAKLCCDEIIAVLKSQNPNYEENTYWHPIDYWQQVKQYLQSLK